MVSVLLLVAELETEELDGETFALDCASVSLDDNVAAELEGASISLDDDVVAELERFSAELGSAEPEISELEEPCVGLSA